MGFITDMCLYEADDGTERFVIETTVSEIIIERLGDNTAVFTYPDGCLGAKEMPDELWEEGKRHARRRRG